MFRFIFICGGFGNGHLHWNNRRAATDWVPSFFHRVSCEGKFMDNTHVEAQGIIVNECSCTNSGITIY